MEIKMEEKKKNKKRASGHSLLLIVIVLALGGLSIYNLESANQEFRESNQTRARLESYYSADAEAEDILMKVDQALQHYQNEISKESLGTKLQNIVKKNGQVNDRDNKAGEVKYSIQIDEKEILAVELEYDLSRPNTKRYDIKKWKVIK